MFVEWMDIVSCRLVVIFCIEAMYIFIDSKHTCDRQFTMILDRILNLIVLINGIKSNQMNLLKNDVSDYELFLFIGLALSFAVNTLAKVQIDHYFPYKYDAIIGKPLVKDGLYRYCAHPIWYSYGLFCILKAYFYGCYSILICIVIFVIHDRVQFFIRMERENMLNEYNEEYRLYLISRF